MTKGELASSIENLAEMVAEQYGATMETKMIIVGGKPQRSRVAVGGFFDLAGARRLLSMAIQKNRDTILAGVTVPTVGNPTGPNIGPDGSVVHAA